MLHRGARQRGDTRGVVEVWADEEPRIAGLDFSVIACPTPYGEYRLGLSYFSTEDYLYEGLTTSARIRIGGVLAPFFGAGLLVGVSEKDESADSDGKDNDGDGSIDESGEEDELRDFSAFIYPEIGVTFQPSWFGITLAARRLYGREFDGDVIYSVGVSMLLGGSD
jgi:hypothetical protein